MIDSLEDAAFDEFTERLAERPESERRRWPAELLRRGIAAGALRWFLPRESGGCGWTLRQQTEAFRRLAAADLTTTFILTQTLGACRRLAAADSARAKERLRRVIDGDVFATVGISHLTTSRQHVARPVLRAAETASGFRLEGEAPWVTGAAQADLLVTGATLEDGRQVLLAVRSDAGGVTAGPGTPLVALTGSCTDRVTFDATMVDAAELLAGPDMQVMQHGSGGSPGGLQTSTLAVGLADAAVDYLQTQAQRRREVIPSASAMSQQAATVTERLLAAADNPAACDLARLRTDANRLALHATQAALTVAKGAGYVATSPVGRWCQEALFFLVWSCPQPVAQSHLCELTAGW